MRIVHNTKVLLNTNYFIEHKCAIEHVCVIERICALNTNMLLSTHVLLASIIPKAYFKATHFRHSYIPLIHPYKPAHYTEKARRPL